PTMLDPVGSGLVQSLARPGGNVTGSSFVGPVLSGKRVEVLKETLPAVRRVAVLWNGANPGSASDFTQTAAAPPALGLAVASLPVREAADFAPAFSVIAREAPDAVLVLPDSFVFTGWAGLLAVLAEQRIPGMGGQREWVEQGGLLAYGPNARALYTRAGDYVAKLFQGAKAADLPVELPTIFEFVINLKTAQTLGLTIPPSVLEQ